MAMQDGEGGEGCVYSVGGKEGRDEALAIYGYRVRE